MKTKRYFFSAWASVRTSSRYPRVGQQRKFPCVSIQKAVFGFTGGVQAYSFSWWPGVTGFTALCASQCDGNATEKEENKALLAANMHV